MSLFMKETDPNKLGKSLSDVLNRQTITLILLMLMALPLLTVQEVDFSGDYALRETFWLGRSSALLVNMDSDCIEKGTGCEDVDFNTNHWVTDEGWYQQLRFMTEATFDDSTQINQKELLWLYVPDFRNQGVLSHIKEIPCANGSICWKESENCAGFNVSDNCEWRFNEMELYHYTPSECLKDESLGCKQFKAFARYMTRPANENENRQTFFTILFTCFIVTLVSFKFTDYITVGVEVPIKKIIDII